jgi:hypothetical protein
VGVLQLTSWSEYDRFKWRNGSQKKANAETTNAQAGTLVFGVVVPSLANQHIGH